MSPASPARYDFSALAVMLAADDGNTRRLLRTILHALGVREVFEAATGIEAFRALESFEADIVISDWHMAPMSGLEFARMVRRDEHSPNRYVPIVMLIGHAESDRVLEARDAGVNMFLAKPISVKALSKRLVALIDNPVGFVHTGTYFGPDRRRRDTGPPAGMRERRRKKAD